MNVVLDTNTWVSALQFGLRKDGSLTTPLQALIRAAASDRIAMCDEIRAEIVYVLTTKFRWETARTNLILDEWLERSLSVVITGSVRACRDPDDDKVLECAVDARAAFLVTGDQDLLALNPFEGIRILTANEYLHSATALWFEMVNQKTDPDPGELVTPMDPPINSTKCLQMASPRPLPLCPNG
jgi:putative PIN family toxin of toxin-antitoxin system